MLICLMGNSGVGKDTVLKSILESAEKSGYENIKQLVTVTNRPIRNSEVSSQYGSKYKPYVFFDDATFENMKIVNAFAEYRSYEVNQPGKKYWEYGTLKFDLSTAMESKDIYLVTCTPTQFTEYYKYASIMNIAHKLYPVYITVSTEKERLRRMVNRVDENNLDELRETCRRFCQDTEYINTSLVPRRFIVYNDDLPFTVGCIFHLIDTFLTPFNEMEEDPWIEQSKDINTFGTLLRL